MKKALALLLCLVMVFGLVACGTAETPATPETPATEAPAAGQPTEMAKDYSGTTLVFSSDAVGSASYNYIVELAKHLEEDGGFGLVDVQPTNPGGMGAPYLFATPGVDLAFINGAPAKWAKETGTLGKDPTGGYSAILGGLTASCYINCISNAFLKKYNVSTIEEIFEQKLPLRIGCSPVGSMDAEGAYKLLEYFGVTEEELKSWGGGITNQGGDANKTAIQDGQIDFYIDHTSSASSTMNEIANTVDVTFLQWGDDLIDWFVTEKGFARVKVPANSFKGQTEELTLPGSPDGIFCADTLDEDTVYQITKTLIENHDAIVSVYPALSCWTVEGSCDSELVGGVAFHPGALKYYQEAGLLGGGDAAPAETKEVKSYDMSGETVVFSSDAVGSASYNYIVELAKHLEEDGGFGLVDVQPTNPGGMGAPYLFATPGVDLAFINGAPAKWAKETGTLGKDPTGGYSAILGGLTASCYINCISNAFLKKYNVSTIEEIFEQKLPLRIGCSPVGSMDAEGAYKLLEYFGVTEEELKSWGGGITNQGGDANKTAIQDGQIDFYIDHTSSASSTMNEIANTVDVTFLQWGDELIDWFVTEKGFARVKVPANSFKGQTEELTLPGSPDGIFCADTLSDEVVYMITKTLIENHDDILSVYPALNCWTIEGSCDSELVGGVAFHPGAIAYYKDAGLL